MLQHCHRPGDRVATLAFNTVRHLEAWWVLLCGSIGPAAPVDVDWPGVGPLAAFSPLGTTRFSRADLPAMHVAAACAIRGISTVRRTATWICIQPLNCSALTCRPCLCACAACRYAISGIGAVCHTLNPRLFEADLEYIINHAQASGESGRSFEAGLRWLGSHAQQSELRNRERGETEAWRSPP